jgi:hypothetical protein
MRKYIIKTSLCFLTLFLPYAIIHSQDSILFIVNESVEVVQLTSDIYQHTSYCGDGDVGTCGSKWFNY